MSILYTADPHVDHDKESQRRGFADHVEWSETFIRNWNAEVRHGDVVYILGDFAMYWTEHARDVLRQLRGIKVLVCGNHDPMAGVHRRAFRFPTHRWMGDDGFASIQDIGVRNVNGRRLLMSHYPYTGDSQGTDRNTWARMRDEGHWLLHGHTHSDQKFSSGPVATVSTVHTTVFRNLQYHVGTQAHGFKPVREEQVIRDITRYEERGGWWDDGRQQPAAVRKPLPPEHPPRA